MGNMVSMTDFAAAAESILARYESSGVQPVAPADPGETGNPTTPSQPEQHGLLLAADTAVSYSKPSEDAPTVGPRMISSRRAISGDPQALLNVADLQSAEQTAAAPRLVIGE